MQITKIGDLTNSNLPLGGIKGFSDLQAGSKSDERGGQNCTPQMQRIMQVWPTLDHVQPQGRESTIVLSLGHMHDQRLMGSIASFGQ